MVGHGGSSTSYFADPRSPIPSHCASIVATSTLRVNFSLKETHTHDFHGLQLLLIMFYVLIVFWLCSDWSHCVLIMFWLVSLCSDYVLTMISLCSDYVLIMFWLCSDWSHYVLPMFSLCSDYVLTMFQARHLSVMNALTLCTMHLMPSRRRSMPA